MQKAAIAILGDASSFLRATRQSMVAAKELEVGMHELSTSVRGSAEAQVAASVKRTSRLREEAASFRAVAASAKKGSAEHIAATNLAARSEQRLAASMGVSTNASRRFGEGTRGAGRDLGRLSRGVLSGSGLFHALGRSVAFASTAFLGGAGLVYAIRTAIGDASNLHEQMNKTRVVFGDSAKSVIQWSEGSAQGMGVANDKALEFSSTIGSLLKPLGVSGAGAARFSTQLTQLGGDLASFYNTDVSDALQAIQSGLTGQVRPLRRYGVALDAARVAQVAMAATGKKHATELTNQEKVLARISIIMKDTALAQGDFKRTSGGLANQSRILDANIHNLSERLGKALYPSVNKVLHAMNDWLGKSKNQKKVQHDVAVAANITIEVLKVLKSVVSAAAGAFRVFSHAVGGSVTAVKLLAGAFLLLHARSKLIKMERTAGELRAAGVAAGVAGSKVSALRGALLGLTKLGPIAIGVTVLMAAKWLSGTSISKKVGGDYSGIDLFNDVKKGLGFGGGGDKGPPRTTNWKGSPYDIEKPWLKMPQMGTLHAPPGPPQLTAAQQLQIGLASTPDNLTLLREQATNEQKQIAALRQKFANRKISPKDFTDAMTDLQTELTGTNEHIASILQDQAQKVKEANDKRVASAKRAAARLKRLHAAAEKQHEKMADNVVAGVSLLFKSTGDFIKNQDKVRKAMTAKVGSFEPSQKLQLAEAKAGATATDKDDMAVARQIRAAARKALKSGKLAFQGQIDAWNAIASANQTLGNQAKSAMTGYRSVGANAITAGLQMSVATRKEIEARLSQSQAHFGHAPTSAGVLGQPVIVHNVHVRADDPHQLAEGLRKIGRHSPTQRRGHNAGPRALK